MRIAYLDCFSGIAGDMTIGAFLDAGLDLAVLKRRLALLGLKGFSLSARKVRRGAIAGTKFDCVSCASHTKHTHKSARQILTMIDRSDLSSRAKKIARDIFAAIATAEAKVHGVRCGGDVRLHEVGEIDSVVDIVGTAVAIDELGIDEIRASVVTMGRAVVDTAHGKLPVPGPAAMELMKGVPAEIGRLDAELVTPTGAAIVKTLSRGFGPMPALTVRAVGYGAGTRDLDGVPNLLRVIIGDRAEPFREETVTVLETSVDDMPPQHAAYLAERLLATGALDVHTTSVAMKKGRPGLMVTVLCAPSSADAMAEMLFRETPTIGIRRRDERRYALARKVVRAKTPFGAVPVKLSRGPGAIRTATPEYEDCARLARAHGVPLRCVVDAARLAVSRKEGGLCDR